MHTNETMVAEAKLLQKIRCVLRGARLRHNCTYKLLGERTGLSKERLNTAFVHRELDSGKAIGFTADTFFKVCLALDLRPSEVLEEAMHVEDPTAFANIVSIRH